MIIYFFCFLCFLYQLPNIILLFLERKSYEKLNLKIKKIKIKEHKISYIEGGDGKTLVFVHGFQGEKRYWRSYIQYFLSYHSLALDLPAHGSSSYKKNEIYDLKYFTNVLDDFIKGKGIEKFSLIGTSLGGAISCMYASRFPEKVEKLILVNPVGIKNSDEDLQKMVCENREKFFPKNFKEFDDLYKYLMGKKAPMRFFVKRMLLKRLKKRKKIFKRIFYDIAKGEGIENLLDKIQAKTLLIFGKKDQILNKNDPKIFSKKIPKNNLLLIEKAEHILLGDAFEKALFSMRNFLGN